MGFKLKEANGNGGVRLHRGGGVNDSLGRFGWFNYWLDMAEEGNLHKKSQSKVSEWLKPRIH